MANIDPQALMSAAALLLHAAAETGDVVLVPGGDMAKPPAGVFVTTDPVLALKMRNAFMERSKERGVQARVEWRDRTGAEVAPVTIGPSEMAEG